jgi:hypothetical protein
MIGMMMNIPTIADRLSCDWQALHYFYIASSAGNFCSTLNNADKNNVSCIDVAFSIESRL